MLIETPDVYADMWAIKHPFDFSDYPIVHKYDMNKKVIGKFKDECCTIPITEFLGLRWKMHSIEKADNISNIRRAEGVVSAVVKKDITHELYKRSLQERREMTQTKVFIRSQEHQIGLYEQNKVSLSPLDTKIWRESDEITTLAYGHYRIL